jgi:hypothetical protein
MKLRFLFLLILILVISQICFGQYREPLFKIHDRGALWETVKDNGQIGGLFSPFEFFPSMDWPGGPDILPTKDEQRSYMQGAGFWIGGKNPNGSTFFNEMGPFLYADQGQFAEMIEEENFIESANYNPNEAEEKITAQWTMDTGIQITRVSRSWSFPEFNDFIIFEYTCSNTTSDNLTDVYIGFPYLIRPSYQDFLAHNDWGDNLNIDDELVGFDQQRNLLYAYDYYPTQDIQWDWGNYIEARGELRTTGYAGFAPLYADPAKDNSPQPATVFYAQIIGNSQKFTLANQSEDQMYALLNGQDQTLQAPVGEVLSPLMLLGFGPYDINAGASVKIVLAEAVNGIPQDLAIKGLSSQTKLPKGLDSLKQTIDRAQRLYDNNYVPTALAPPSPEVEFFVLPSSQEIVVTWPTDVQDWEDPLSGEKDLSYYNIYRSDRSFIGPFKKLRSRGIKLSGSDRSRYFDNELGKWKYKDNTVQVGVGYYYAVTSVDKDGRESGMTNRNTEALVTAREPAENALNVSVFPNPFRLVSGLPTAGEESSLVFTNLPEVCTIRIFTVNGELVTTIEHKNPNSGEEVWQQLTDSRQKTAAGIYLYTVESEVGTAKGTILLIK